MPPQPDEPHEPLDMPVSGGHRYTCAICEAVVSIPTDLLVSWNHEGRLMANIQAQLTRTLLLRTGHYGVTRVTSRNGGAATYGFDAIRFYAALDAYRTACALDWKNVAAQTGVPASTLTRLGQGKKPSADNLAALIEWSGLDMRDYIRLAPTAQEGE